eukprot:584971-Rhodomonas_salina.1
MILGFAQLEGDSIVIMPVTRTLRDVRSLCRLPEPEAHWQWASQCEPESLAPWAESSALASDHQV